MWGRNGKKVNTIPSPEKSHCHSWVSSKALRSTTKVLRRASKYSSFLYEEWECSPGKIGVGKVGAELTGSQMTPPPPHRNQNVIYYIKRNVSLFERFLRENY